MSSYVVVTVTVETTTAAASSTHSPVPQWSGSGSLLQGYCATPEYTLLGGPTAYWAPVIGCAGNKPDCCPFDVPRTTVNPTATGPQTITIPILASGSALATGVKEGFPIALSPDQSTLSSCPDDYHSIGGGCCPSDYLPWSTAFGGQTPCYSTLPIATTPPPIPETSATTATDLAVSRKPTSAIVNVVYAMQYPVIPSNPGLSLKAKIGIGAGAGGAALILGVLLWLYFWMYFSKRKLSKSNKVALELMNRPGAGVNPNRQDVNETTHYAAMNTGSTVGATDDWRRPGMQSRFPVAQVPTLPSVGDPDSYPVDWRPGKRRAPPSSTSIRRTSMTQQDVRYTNPSIPEGYHEVEGRPVDNRTFSLGSDLWRTEEESPVELQGGDCQFPRQTAQGGHEREIWDTQPQSDPRRAVAGQRPQSDVGGTHIYYEMPGGTGNRRET